jgi:3-oxoacyl-[acyl-carrier protein] reductase
MNLHLTNKVALITGAARGIGAAIAHTFAEEGVSVVIADINLKAAETYASQLRNEGFSALAVECDVASPEQVDNMVATTVEHFNGVDILINNAGFVRDKRITKMEIDDFDSVLACNLRGPWLCSRAVLPHMADNEWGRIINISSRAHWGNPGQSNYASAKAGIIGLTRSLAMEWGRKNITVNAVAPGLVVTEAALALPHWEKVRDGALAKNTVPRLGEPQDIANMVVFLASDRAAYVNGDLVHVTGGRYAG